MKTRTLITTTSYSQMIFTITYNILSTWKEWVKIALKEEEKVILEEGVTYPAWHLLK